MHGDHDMRRGPILWSRRILLVVAEQQVLHATQAAFVAVLPVELAIPLAILTGAQSGSHDEGQVMTATPAAG